MAFQAEHVRAQIAALRKAKGWTQAELGERVGVSFQAVSKWERGETLPDIAVLVDLARALETSVDNILTGGEKMIHYKGKITVSDMQKGVACLGKMGDYLGRSNALYRYAIQGIDENMNTSIEEAFTDDYIMECFVAEAILQNLMDGAYIDLTDVNTNLKYEHFRKIVCDFAARYGIT